MVRSASAHDPFSESQVGGCLRDFERQGGKVDWTNKRLRELLANAPRERTTSKNAPGTQLSHHAKCADHYTPDLARQIERENKKLYKAFGWKGCCNSEGFLNL